MSPTNGDETSLNRVLPASRVLAAIIVPILFVAFVMLYIFPDNSGVLFAWPIKPRMTAMMLGATYLGGVFFFSQVVFAKSWHTVRLGFLPVTAFAAILGIATLLHWYKFTPGHISFILWAFLYLTLPFIIPLVWYLNERASRSSSTIDGPDSGARFPAILRWSLGTLGVILAVVSALMLIIPEVIIPTWPWTLSPLTARVISAMFALSGWVGIGVARDGRWSSASTIFGAQVISITLFLLAVFLARADILWSSLTSYTFIAGLLLDLGLIGWAAVWAGSQ